MKKIHTIIAGPLIVLFLLTSLLASTKQAEAQVIPVKVDFETTPTGPFVTTFGVCCNGIKFNISGKTKLNALATGDFIFPFTNMVPIPSLGLGFYSWWMIRTGSSVLGSATPGGACLTISSECESSDVMDWTVKQIGTDLI